MKLIGLVALQRAIIVDRQFDVANRRAKVSELRDCALNCRGDFGVEVVEEEFARNTDHKVSYALIKTRAGIFFFGDRIQCDRRILHASRYRTSMVKRL